MKKSNSKLWTAISGIPPVVIGIAGAVILALEGQILGTLLTVVLVAIHRYSESLMGSRLSADQTADWTAVRAMTTVCCLGLPFYLALTMI
jgi:mannose/fructose/N-acetylgalactosamine-specific phosphotransferase system component IID